MEKFSTWRDPSTGLAPFVYPLPPLSAFQLPSLLWIPLLPLALFRTLCLLFLAASFVSLDALARVLSIFSVRFHATFQYYCTTIFARIALHLLGFTTLPSDPPFSHRTSSQKLISTPVQPGDVVVCNWSSYVDVIYLAYLYNPIFILPVFLKDGDGAEQGATDPVVHAFERKSLVQIVARTGHPPTTTTTIITSTTKNIKSLAQFLHDSRRLQRPLVVFPEGTTSNNRALLKCPRMSQESVGKLKGKVRMFCMAIKHEPATGLKRSITVPIPSGMGSVFLQMMETNVVPVLMAGMLSPRTLLVRFPRHADNMLLLLDPLLHPPQFLQHAFRTAFDHIAVAAKLKITNHISALHKAAFLNYARHRKLT